MQELFEKLSEKIIKEEDLLLLVEQLELIKKFIFSHPEIPLSEKLKNKIDENLRKEIKKLEEEKILPSSPEEQFSFFEKFKNFLLKIPKIKLEIAFEPNDEFILTLDKWFKENLGKKLIFDIYVNQKIVGGVKIEYQGIWRDFSLEKEIEKIYGRVQ